MDALHSQAVKADRLYEVTQRVGFALWQLQELEGTSAMYYVLAAQATPGMSLVAGQALVDKAQGKTFGATITQLVKAEHLSADVESRFQALLRERNWLVHSSRSSSRDAVHNDQVCLRVIERLDAIAEEASLLLKEMVKRAEVFVKKHGITAANFDELVAQTLAKWHAGNAL